MVLIAILLSVVALGILVIVIYRNANPVRYVKGRSLCPECRRPETITALYGSVPESIVCQTGQHTTLLNKISLIGKMLHKKTTQRKTVP